jgi:hypothetical protein
MHFRRTLTSSRLQSLASNADGSPHEQYVLDNPRMIVVR